MPRRQLEQKELCEIVKLPIELAPHFARLDIDSPTELTAGEIKTIVQVALELTQYAVVGFNYIRNPKAASAQEKALRASLKELQDKQVTFLVSASAYHSGAHNISSSTAI